MPIILPILYKDDPKALRAAERRLEQFGKNVAKVTVASFAGAGLAAAKFGFDSVRAFAEAERAQLELQFAFEKFPKLADTNVDALNRLNTALMKKTRFDDDAIASAQGLLASFQLTGKQITDLTPLLLDYAARTGRDLPSAAEALGKAMLGQGRALKEVGIDFEDAGSLAGNFDQIMAGLREQVGGFAEKDADTAAGKLEMLRNRFGEVQERVGEALMPALDRLLDWLEGDGIRAMEDFAGWFAGDGMEGIQAFIDVISQMGEDGTLVPNIIAGLTAITAAQWLLNAAMAANPVGLIIAGIIALGALIAAIIINFDQVSRFMQETGANVMIFLGQTLNNISSFFNDAFGGIRDVINAMAEGLNNFYAAIGVSTRLQLISKNPDTELGDDMIRNGQRSLVALRGGTGGGSGSGYTRMARGGLVVGPTRSLIGEGGPEVVAPYDQFIDTLSMANGGGGAVYNVTVNAGIGTDGVSVGREIVKAIKRYERASGPVFAGA
jgi:hypothetical protein